MKRRLFTALAAWQQKSIHKPILLRGARQVGKTYLVEQLGAAQFEHLVSINFEYEPEYMDCFKTLDPIAINNAIGTIKKQPIIPGKTLLFLDEIQECPQAILALRYFKEKLPEQHVIGAGSLLEFTLNSAAFRMPVGRVQFFYLKPLSFEEFLLGSGDDALLAMLAQARQPKDIADVIHQHALKRVREYFILGGMPEVLQTYRDSKSLNECQIVQSDLLNTYRRDFGKYSTRAQHKYLQQVFTQAPQMIGQHIKYSKIDPNMRSRDLKTAFENLTYAGLITPVTATSATGLPLNALVNSKKFKCIFVDTGLVKRVSNLDVETLRQEDLMLVNQGMLAEQFVGQELMAYMPYYEEAELFFWERDKKGSMAEVDFVINIDNNIIPIEVKAGKTGRLRSLKLFMQEKNCKLGIRVSQQPLSFAENILSIPFYLLGQLKNIAKQYL